MIYVCYKDINRDSCIGIKKKILAQCRVFEQEFETVYYTIFAGQVLYLLRHGKIVDKEFALTKKMCNDTLLQWLTKYNIKRVYIRYEFSDIWFLEFLHELKKMSIKTVLEFPTIPYDGERVCIRLEEDKYYRKQLFKYVECCTTYANYKSVFDIPCIPLVNGVDILEHREKIYRRKEGEIILLAVAGFARWHGYERVIQGMNQYYSNNGERNIIFKLVGDGGQLAYYQRITEEYQLQKHVVFCGKLEGKDLDEVYDNSDIAIGSLGLYKTGIKSIAPIKLREYCARGIPFIYGYDDPSFGNDNYFRYQVPNDSSPIDINELIKFYNQMYDGRDFIKDMRQYAALHLTWDNILQPIIKYLS